MGDVENPAPATASAPLGMTLLFSPSCSNPALLLSALAIACDHRKGDAGS